MMQILASSVILQQVLCMISTMLAVISAIIGAKKAVRVKISCLDTTF